MDSSKAADEGPLVAPGFNPGLRPGVRDRVSPGLRPGVRDHGLTPIQRWLLIFALWTIPPLFTSTAVILRFQGQELPVPAWRFFLNQLTLWYPWALLTPLIFRLGRLFPLLGRRAWLHALLHAAFSFLAGVGFFAFLLVLEIVNGADLRAVEAPVFLRTYLSTGPFNSVIYWILLGVGTAIAYHQRNREREALLTRARLQALKAQVHPHFLFNTLHAISSLIDEDVQAARRMIARLSELLRASLTDADDEVRLEQELELARLYLEIEEVRFADRLHVSWKIEDDTHDATVPRLVLQPLVENAVRHGISRATDAGHIEIAAHRRGETLCLTVLDDGPGLDGHGGQDTAGQAGIGLANTRSRLAEMYGASARLTLAEREGRGCSARLELPFRTAAF